MWDDIAAEDEWEIDHDSAEHELSPEELRFHLAEQYDDVVIATAPTEREMASDPLYGKVYTHYFEAMSILNKRQVRHCMALGTEKEIEQIGQWFVFSRKEVDSAKQRVVQSSRVRIHRPKTRGWRVRARRR